MSLRTYFVQECETCGRNLQVRVEYLGKLVICQHCGGRFQAKERRASVDSAVEGSSLLERADQLLREAAESGIHVG